MTRRDYTNSIKARLENDGWRLVSIGHYDGQVRLMFLDASDCPFTFGEVAMVKYTRGCKWTIELFYPKNYLSKFEAEKREQWLKEAEAHGKIA